MINADISIIVFLYFHVFFGISDYINLIGRNQYISNIDRIDAEK